MTTSTYSIALDYGDDPNPSHVDFSPYWIVAVISQGTLMTFDRKQLKSRFTNLANDPVLNSTPPLIISDDCLNISVSGNKRNPIKSLNLSLKQTDVNYLTRIFPGDYIMAWIVNNEAKYLDLLDRIKNIQPANRKDDGLKFVGRLQDIRKKLTINPNIGTKIINYMVTGVGFEELQTAFFYDYSLASNDAQEQSLGTWLARMGVTFENLFGQSAETAIQENNINSIIPTLLNLILGSGPSKNGNISIPSARGTATATPTLDNEAPYAYVIPITVGKLLGVGQQINPDKPTSVLSYSDILNLTIGIQKFSGKPDQTMFVPDLKPESTFTRSITNIPLLGTFLPYFTEFTNVPIWELVKKYLNPTINDLYTALQINKDGNIVPTVVCRQIPFTTEAFQQPKGTTVPGPTLDNSPLVLDIPPIETTKFLDLPRWLIPTSCILGLDIGRSDVMRKNFIHIYGSASLMAGNVGINEQIINNPPIRDDLSIQTHGLHPYMTTVECFVSSEVGTAPTQWMALVADWSIGAHLTINGVIECFGVQSPIEVGQNVEFDGVVYHIEGINHMAGIDPNSGTKTFRTTLQLSNGLRVDGQTDDFGITIQDKPIYAGVYPSDQTKYDPGLSLEGPRSMGGIPINQQPQPKIIFTPDPFKDSATVNSDLQEVL